MPPLPWPPVATFSILGYDPATGEVGGAVQSRVFSVGNGVLWAEAGTNPSHGCIRVPDPAIRKLAPLVSPGTPVDIVA